jgi:uncharacterized protein (DUF433 family)
MNPTTPPRPVPLTEAPLLPDWHLARRPPISLDSDGIYRVGGTRVRLDTVVTAFQRGCTAEEIMLKYPSLELADVYSTLAYSLENREAVDAYLESKRREAGQAERELEARFPSAGVRERLLARRDAHS